MFEFHSPNNDNCAFARQATKEISIEKRRGLAPLAPGARKKSLDLLEHSLKRLRRRSVAQWRGYEPDFMSSNDN